MRRNINLNRATQKRGGKRASIQSTAAIRERLAQDGYVPTDEEIKALYGAPMTLGAPHGQREKKRMAMDNQMQVNGSFSLIQHAAQMGMLEQMGVSFMGYGALSGLTQNGLIRACVETVADDMTREFIEVHATDSDGDGTDTDEHRNIMDGIADYEVREKCHKACEWDGYFGGALIFIDTGASDDQLLTPLDISETGYEIHNFKRFQVIEPINCFPGQYESTDPTSPYYYEARTWWILGKEVHSSRVIRVVSNEMPVILKPAYNFFGLPQAQVLYDYVLHFQESRMAAVRSLKKFSLTIFKTAMQDILTNPHSTASLDDRLNFLAINRDNEGIEAIDKDLEDIVQINTPLGGITDIVRQQLELVVAINRTNVVKTLGMSPAGFNTGDSDMQNHYDHIHTMQEKTLRHAVQKMLDIIQLKKNGTLKRSVDFSFVPLGEEDENAKSQRNAQKAQSDQTYMDNGVLSIEEVRHSLATDPDSYYKGIDPDDLPTEGEPDTDDGDLNDQSLNFFDNETPADTDEPVE